MQLFLISNPDALGSTTLGKLATAMRAPLDTARQYSPDKPMACYWSEKGNHSNPESPAIKSFRAVENMTNMVGRIKFCGDDFPPYELAKACSLYIAGGNALDYLKAAHIEDDQSGNTVTLADKIQARRHIIPTTIVGSSAGAIMMGPHARGVATQAYGASLPEATSIPGLGLIKSQIIPHYGAPKKPFYGNYSKPNIDLMLRGYANLKSTADTDCRFILLEEDACLHIDFDRKTSKVFGQAHLTNIAQDTFETLTDEMLADEVVW